MRTGRAARILGLAVAALAAACALPPVREDAVVMGRVIAGEGAACGVGVSLIGRGGGVVARATTDESGAFSAMVPAGSYTVVAHEPAADPGRPRPGERYANPARNPIQLPPGGDAWVGLQMIVVHPEDRLRGADGSSSAISGTVTFQGLPVEGAVATLYPEGGEGGDRGLGLTSTPPTGPDGTFSFGYLAPGSYRLTVRKRQGGGREGPIREGDLEGYYPLNPITVRSGDLLRVTVEVTEKKRPFFMDNLSECPTVGIAGIIRDGEGRPIEGVYVFAYRNREMGKGKPDALSALTGADGRYQLPLPAGGRYFIGARERFGGGPEAGEWYGLFVGSAQHDLVVPQRGVLQGIDLTVQRIVGESENTSK